MNAPSMIQLIREGAETTIRRQTAIASHDGDVCEGRARNIFFPALAEFRSACQEAQAMTLTPGVKDMFRTLLNALEDHSPTEDTWAEMIAGRK